jgi:hypothetical protein
MHPSRQAYVEEAQPEVSFMFPSYKIPKLVDSIHILPEVFALSQMEV